MGKCLFWIDILILRPYLWSMQGDAPEKYGIRPLILWLVPVVYCLIPIVNFLQVMWQFRTTFRGALLHYPAVGALLMILAPVVGIGLFLQKRWGYRLFLAHSILLILYNLSFFSHRSGTIPATNLLVTSLGLIILFWFVHRAYARRNIGERILLQKGPPAHIDVPDGRAE